MVRITGWAAKITGIILSPIWIIPYALSHKVEETEDSVIYKFGSWFTFEEHKECVK
jgi:hypothetical protein